MTNVPPVYLRVSERGALSEIDSYRPFRAVIILRETTSEDLRTEVARWLVDSGCRYAMTWGVDCEAWHDAVDWASIDKFSPDDVPDDQFIMTTWHENETLEGAFWFAQFCASQSYDGVELENTLLVDVSTSDQRDETLQLFEQSFTLADREPD